jgi:hypothetical protein
MKTQFGTTNQSTLIMEAISDEDLYDLYNQFQVEDDPITSSRVYSNIGASKSTAIRHRSHHLPAPLALHPKKRRKSRARQHYFQIHPTCFAPGSDGISPCLLLRPRASIKICGFNPKDRHEGQLLCRSLHQSSEQHRVSCILYQPFAQLTIHYLFPFFHPWCSECGEYQQD